MIGTKILGFGGYQPDKGVHWPREVEESFENYIRNGGGLVIDNPKTPMPSAADASISRSLRPLPTATTRCGPSPSTKTSLASA